LNNKCLKSGIFFFVSILWLELFYRIYALNGSFDRGILYIIVFALPLAAAFTFLTKVWKSRKTNRIFGILCLSLITFWFFVETVYATVFRTVMLVSSVKMAGMVFNSYWKETLVGIWKCLYVLILEAVPVIFFIAATGQKRREKIKLSFLVERSTTKRLKATAFFFMTLTILAELSTYLPSGGLMTTREMYRQSFDPTVTVQRFGMLNTFKLDIWQMAFGLEEKPEEELALVAEQPEADPPVLSEETTTGETADGSPEVTTQAAVEAEPEIVYDDNVMDIDFAALAETRTNDNLKKLDEYFAARRPTSQNEYTGMFEGYNLVFICGETFWKYAVNETYTPTLYKMANEGFVFNNYYCPLGTHSTCDGEFACTQSLCPSNQYTAFYETIGDNMYFALGNQLKDIGYPCTAYHPHYREYYRRDETHPNLGYDYYGIGTHGINIAMTWPESDLDMMKFVWEKQKDTQTPFHLYFMTISGHLNYSWDGNAMCKKHKDDVAALAMGEESQAYIACQMELDQACEYLINSLDEAGMLDNTLFVICGDHYPYAMQPGSWNELAGHEVDQTFELAQSSLIIWNSQMEEPVQVDKTCCSLDILPTVSNLMGLEYDSRLLMGRDVFSDSDGIAVFYNKSFITDQGKYDVKTNSFTPNEGCTPSEEYVKQMYNYVNGLFTASDLILKNDYYDQLGITHDITPGKSLYYK